MPVLMDSGDGLRPPPPAHMPLENAGRFPQFHKAREDDFRSRWPEFSSSKARRSGKAAWEMGVCEIRTCKRSDACYNSNEVQGLKVGRTSEAPRRVALDGEV